MRVIIESPYAGDVFANMRYLNNCIRDSILNYQEAPFASHIMYTGALNDDKPDERNTGMAAGFEWYKAAEKVIVYTDLGISSGMLKGIKVAEILGLPLEYRTLNKV